MSNTTYIEIAGNKVSEQEIINLIFSVIAIIGQFIFALIIFLIKRSVKQSDEENKKQFKDLENHAIQTINKLDNISTSIAPLTVRTLTGMTLVQNQPNEPISDLTITPRSNRTVINMDNLIKSGTISKVITTNGDEYFV